MQRATIVVSAPSVFPFSAPDPSLQEYEAHGIRPSYDAVTLITNALKNIIRRGMFTHLSLFSTTISHSPLS
jgi:hypothetical protein